MREKARGQRVRWAARIRTRVNHCGCIDRRDDGIKTGERRTPGTKARTGWCVPSARGWPACCPGGARCRGGVSSPQALAWNRRTCRPDTVGQGNVPGCEGEDRKRRTPQAAEYRGGAQGRDGP